MTMSETLDILTPYARSLGIEISEETGDAPTLLLPFTSIAEGRPGVLHGLSLIHI